MSVVIHCLDDRIFGKVLQENAGLYGVRFYCFDVDDRQRHIKKYKHVYSNFLSRHISVDRALLYAVNFRLLFSSSQSQPKQIT